MGQFRITQEDGLANRIARLESEWLSIKNTPFVGLDKSVFYYYESPEYYNSYVIEDGRHGVTQSQVTVLAKFTPDDGDICYIIPEIQILPKETPRPVIFGGLKQVQRNSNGSVYFETRYTIILDESRQSFSAKITVYSSSPGILAVTEARD